MCWPRLQKFLGSTASVEKLEIARAWSTSARLVEPCVSGCCHSPRVFRGTNAPSTIPTQLHHTFGSCGPWVAPAWNSPVLWLQATSRSSMAQRTCCFGDTGSRRASPPRRTTAGSIPAMCVPRTAPSDAAVKEAPPAQDEGRHLSRRARQPPTLTLVSPDRPFRAMAAPYRPRGGIAPVLVKKSGSLRVAPSIASTTVRPPSPSTWERPLGCRPER